MLKAGARLGDLEVRSLLGAGGMGEVYRAYDAHLGREVALKILPDRIARDPARLTRFEREAKLLASLSHPGIAALHGVAESPAGPVLILELVEGRSLTECMRHGPLPLQEALEIGRQIADALSAAHESGVIHCDIKPSNVKITPQGRIKLLDFGVACIARGSPAEISQLATDNGDPSPTGGTAPYMSPEHLRGEPLDRRADVWSFGCVLYELMSGRCAFAGPTRADTISSILEREPDWTALPRGMPPLVRSLLRRCLRKDRAQRLHDIADASLELEEALGEASPASAAPPGRTLTPKMAAAALAAGLLAAGLVGSALTWMLFRQPREVSAPRRLSLRLPANLRVPGGDSGATLAFSTDGTRVVFLAASAEGDQRLYEHGPKRLAPRTVPHTEGAAGPFLSPDGRWLGFSQGGWLKKMQLDGKDPPVPLAEASALRGASWGADDSIVYSPTRNSGLWRISAGGGPGEPLTTPDPEKDEAAHRWPEILSNGKGILFTVHRAVHSGNDSIAVLDLGTGRWREVLARASYARSASSGHLVFNRRTALLAAPFDAERLRVTGEVLRVLEDVETGFAAGGVAAFAMSQAGSLLYQPRAAGSDERSLLWVDRDGNAEPVSPSQRAWSAPALSRQGRVFAVEVQGPESSEVWLFDLRRRSWARLARQAGNPIWSPDGKWLACRGQDGIVRQRADGTDTPELLHAARANITLNDWSLDGRYLVFSQHDHHTDWDVWILPLQDGRPAYPFIATTSYEGEASFSPDGRWLAYTTDETGTQQVVVRRFPSPGARWLISTGGGFAPRWRADGREIFYRERAGHARSARTKLVAVPVPTGLGTAAPRPLFDDVFLHVNQPLADYDVSADGERFLMVQEGAADQPGNHFVILLDWGEQLRATWAARR